MPIIPYSNLNVLGLTSHKETVTGRSASKTFRPFVYPSTVERTKQGVKRPGGELTKGRNVYKSKEKTLQRSIETPCSSVDEYPTPTVSPSRCLSCF